MADAPWEAKWRAEFERLGEVLIYNKLKQGAIYKDEAKWQPAIRRFGEQARKHRVEEAWRRRGQL